MVCRVLYAMLRDKKNFDASMLKAREPRVSVERTRLYRMKPHAAKSC
jgi:hypothetical protein